MLNDRTNNRLNMVNTCIGLANSTEHQPVWTGKDPADFGPDLLKLKTGYDAVMTKAARVNGTGGGAADAKADAETRVENTAYVLARALAVHFKKTGNLINLGKVDIAKRDLVKLSGQPLIAKTTEIRDLANASVGEPNAASRGVTDVRVDNLSDAIDAYAPLVNAPRGQIVNRSALLKEIETHTAGLLDQLADLDDLILQFDGTEAGQRFIAAWKRARIIVDAGHGPGTEETPAPAPTPTP
jgi:hypothetical protein